MRVLGAEIRLPYYLALICWPQMGSQEVRTSYRRGFEVARQWSWWRSSEDC
jgi:hypothetical protein